MVVHQVPQGIGFFIFQIILLFSAGGPPNHPEADPLFADKPARPVGRPSYQAGGEPGKQIRLAERLYSFSHFTSKNNTHHE